MVARPFVSFPSVDVFRSGKYKSMADMISARSMPAAVRENVEALVDDLYNSYLQRVAEVRGDERTGTVVTLLNLVLVLMHC